ncbi:MAG: flagellar biosynthesis protein FlhB [Candidatus Hydrogenedentes bacterium]|nr:flagellar biosynthesis protein FlhB [Candidatus Hydrogenedentota bacterium]
MPESPGGERTEPATAKRREELRKKGQVAHSRDMNSTAILMAGAIGLTLLGPMMFDHLFNLVGVYLSNSCQFHLSPTNFIALSISVAAQMGIIIVPLMIVVLVAAILINLAQKGVMITFEPMEPKLDKLNPIAGFSKFLSVRSLVELPKSLAKIILLGFIGYITVRGRMDRIVPLMTKDPAAIFTAAAGLFMLLTTRIIIAMVFLSILDFGFEKWQFERENRMTKQEVRDELKQFEGDPLIRSRIRQIQRQVAMQRMMAAIPEAEVVVTNPTEIAVALRYDAAKMDAPHVVAKGQRLIADRIRSIAIEHSVPIVENPTLARTLFASVEIGQMVPETTYKAVAEVLAYVYRIERRTEKIRERREMRPVPA